MFQAHEILALEILALLLENPTNDSVEVAIGFLKECGQKLTDVSPRGINCKFLLMILKLSEAIDYTSSSSAPFSQQIQILLSICCLTWHVSISYMQII